MRISWLNSEAQGSCCSELRIWADNGTCVGMFWACLEDHLALSTHDCGQVKAHYFALRFRSMWLDTGSSEEARAIIGKIVPIARERKSDEITERPTFECPWHQTVRTVNDKPL